ncbi:2'-5' RNA ligase family protein [Rhizobium sp. CNPSo 3490]|nr:2'-5' RNA ligase family protein [Rhizobium sp. CNPSo 3490]MDK4731511.1 2'-5' RNA ligase family protein [Rhizobium sp. CNPSo 3490]
MILTARIAEHDLVPFDLLRQKHFPPERNFLRAHLTMFHRLPGEYVDRIVESLQSVAKETRAISARVSGIRHLGAGVAFVIGSPDLNAIRHILRGNFVHWLGSQDMQTWRPHITIQNKASVTEANRLHRELSGTFHAHDITIVGLDLWRYLDGPWASEATVPLVD